MAESQEMQQLHKLLEDLEAVAEEVMCDQQEIITLDKRRNTNREALRALKKTCVPKHQPLAPEECASTSSLPSVPLCHSAVNSSHAWMCIGDMFMSMPKTFLVSSIEKEQEQMDKAIDRLRDGLRHKVDTLRRLEGEEPRRGALLRPLSRDEWAGVEKMVAHTK
ncbi:p53 and DNA damage-regulated protein 1-like [Hyalella azteca]|uniref:P53 and DNA damage-regulated protein 1-like n=1 Tax=Hyalella azteca TaxID=294128 RepID=A0A8B7N3S1_HYAAZ|nr:p53 and DNA damage-regulated protein 1-like [Hyalella azteca]